MQANNMDKKMTSCDIIALEHSRNSTFHGSIADVGEECKISYNPVTYYMIMIVGLLNMTSCLFIAFFIQWIGKIRLFSMALC